MEQCKRWVSRTAFPFTLAAVALLAINIFPVERTVATASSSDLTVVFDGGGWGHGRGMGQYGAYGYASDHGWTARQILDHFYKGTTAGQAPARGSVDPSKLRVDLSSRIGSRTTVALGSGELIAQDPSGQPLVRSTGAMRITAGNGIFLVETGPGCDGPWEYAEKSNADRVEVISTGSGVDRESLLQVCGGSPAWYGGQIWATVGNGAQRTINVVSVEEYLRGVVPNEVPASWPTAALQAQAVAARSYVLAGDPRRGTFSDTCDTIYCQVYDGRYTTRGGLRSATHLATDAAVAATAGQVRVWSDGTVARTEFSSSTGGHTVDGDFAAVADEGDSVSANPNASWSQSVAVSDIEAIIGGTALRSVTVVERDGNGRFGGRALTVEFEFAERTTRLDGDAVRSKLGLKSTLFDPRPIEQPDRTEDIAFIVSAYERFTGRAPTDVEVTDGLRSIDLGARRAFTAELASSEAFATILVADLYRAALGRNPDADGAAYWAQEMTEGIGYELVGTLFHGSVEYYNRAGANDEAFVDALYRNVLGREADAGGQAYWIEQLANNRATTADVANSFYRSIESRRDRSRRLGRIVLDRELSTAQTETAADLLRSSDDLSVAAEIATWD